MSTPSDDERQRRLDALHHLAEDRAASATPASDEHVAGGVIEHKAGGVSQEESLPAAQPTFYDNVTIAGGPAPARAYIGELLPDVLDGRIEPGRVFGQVTNLDAVPDGYRAMNDREAIKVLVEVSR
jgi:threonine dehydrogenase-like Zn-dependent dehydrogenase